MREDDWRWHMYDTVKGSDWLGDQDAIEFMCRAGRAEAVYELEHFGVPFSRTGRRQDVSARLRRHDDAITARSMAQRTCAAADRTGHAMLHTLYRPDALQLRRRRSSSSIFALDLLMDDDGACRGVMAWKLDDGTHPPVSCASTVILATGGYGRVYFSCTSGAHLHRRRQRDGAARGPAAAGHGVRAVPSRPAFMARACLITEGSRGEGGYLTNSRR